MRRRLSKCEKLHLLITWMLRDGIAREITAMENGELKVRFSSSDVARQHENNGWNDARDPRVARWTLINNGLQPTDFKSSISPFWLLIIRIQEQSVKERLIILNELAKF